MAHPHRSGSMFFDALVHKVGLNCLKSTTTYFPHSCRVNQFISVEQKILEKVYLSIGNYIFYLSQGREYPARFSFILDISLENPIKHHHSSRIKEN